MLFAKIRGISNVRVDLIIRRLDNSNCRIAKLSNYESTNYRSRSEQKSMAIRIAGVVLPEKRLEVALTYIFGIGKTRASEIIARAALDKNRRPKELNEEEVARLRDAIERGLRVEGDLKREIIGNIKRLKEIGTWRGSRHIRRLPIHGRTKTNSRTTRGNVRKTMGSGRRAAAEKT